MNGKSIPSIPALKSVCDAFGISLAEFFAEDDIIVATPEVKELLNGYSILTKDEKDSILQIIKNYLKRKQ